MKICLKLNEIDFIIMLIKYNMRYAENKYITFCTELTFSIDKTKQGFGFSRI